MEQQLLEERSQQDLANPAKAPRQLLFISHATPEDSTFAKWLATQLAIAGYEVWCDVTKLLGGERFWDDISEAIEDYAFRFIFVSTLEGNNKLGTRRELSIAQKTQEENDLKDFIIPLKVDPFPIQSMDESLQDLNIVFFDDNWAQGLKRLLKLLEREHAPRSDQANASCVSEWYRRSLEESRKTVVSNDPYLSNWFRLSFPPVLRFHLYRGARNEVETIAAEFDYPCRVHEKYLVTFATGNDVQERFGEAFDPKGELSVNTQDFVEEGHAKLSIKADDASRMVTDLLRQGFEAEMARKPLLTHRMANDRQTWFFEEGHFENNRAYYSDCTGKLRYRQLVGRKSKRNAQGELQPDGFWHYAISASIQLRPFPRLLLRHHVIFTGEGKTPWANSARMHRARRRVCKQWWNHHWRDRLLAMCCQLGAGEDELQIPLGNSMTMDVELVPMQFTSPWSYFEDGKHGVDEDSDIELVEEIEDEEEENLEEDVEDEDEPEDL
ncbi:MAG: toll/interleukin-1 receptor domain-containing protein [Pseudomonadales bacterium]